MVIHFFFRTGNFHYLLHDLMQQPDLHCIRRLIIDLFSDTAAFQKAAVRQRAQMVGYGGTGHIQHDGNIGHAFLLMAQQPENADAGGVAQLLEYFRYGCKMRQVQQFAVEAGGVFFSTVVMGQRKIGHMISSCLFWKFPSPFRKYRAVGACFFICDSVYYAYND